ncbi:MAG: flagellar motor switch protein FliG, partial [Aquimonas sp.]
MTGTQRAAVLLMSLGESEAAEVLRQLNAKEVQKLGVAMSTIRNVTKDQVIEVVDEFV